MAIIDIKRKRTRFGFNYDIFKNRCMYCGKIISSGFVCGDCKKRIRLI